MPVVAVGEGGRRVLTVMKDSQLVGGEVLFARIVSPGVGVVHSRSNLWFDVAASGSGFQRRVSFVSVLDGTVR